MIVRNVYNLIDVVNLNVYKAVRPIKQYNRQTNKTVNWKQLKAPCGLDIRGQIFGEACCFHLQGWSSRRVNPKEHNQNRDRRENRKCHTEILIQLIQLTSLAW